MSQLKTTIKITLNAFAIVVIDNTYLNGRQVTHCSIVDGIAMKMQ